MSSQNLLISVDRRNTDSLKWNPNAIKSLCNNENATPFWVADLDFKSPQVVYDALAEYAQHGVLGYSLFDSVVETYVKWAQQKHNWTIEDSLVVPSIGMLSSIALLIELYSSVGDNIILPMPAYRPFVRLINALQRNIIKWPMLYDKNENHFTLDLNAFESLAKQDKTPILLFCSPHNPTQRVFSFDELDKIASLAAKHNIVVISDEIHGDLTFNKTKHTPFDTVAKKHGTACATCVSPSKTFNIAGEHFSYVIASDAKMQKKLSDKQNSLNLKADLLATKTAIAAYQGGMNWLINLLTYLEEQALYVKNALEESNLGLKIVAPEASFIALIDCSSIYEKVVLDREKNRTLYLETTSPEGGLLSRFFGQRANIAMNDGSWFGKEYRNFVRFNFGTNSDNIKKGVVSIIEAVNSL